MNGHELKETQGSVRSAPGDKRLVTLIRAGWGSSGYYSEEVLARDIPKAFPVGTHMYLDHPTAREGAERPERSVRDLVGTIVETPRMAGIDSVAVAEVFPHWKPVIDAVADDIGLSIRALGEVEEGSAGGKDGPIVQALTEGLSVDYVTHPGAGGSVGALIESARKVDQETPDPELVAMAEALAEEWLIEVPALVIETSNVYEEVQAFWERTVSKDERVALAKKGQAIPVKDDQGNIINGRFPMANCGDVSNAAQSIGRGSEENDKLKAFITRVASKLSCPVPFKTSESGSGRQKQEDYMSSELETKLSEALEKVRQLEGNVEEAEKARDDAKKEAEEATTRADRAEDALRAREARSIVTEAVGEVKGLPKRAAERAVEAALREEIPLTEDGKIKKEALQETAKGKAKEEKEYLVETKGHSVSGFGESSSGNGGSSDEDKKALQEEFEAGGLSESAAKAAAEGR